MSQSIEDKLLEELGRRYHTRGVGGGPVGLGKRPAVVIVDLQKGFTDPQARLGSELDDVVGSCRRLVEFARELSIPVVYTITSFPPNLNSAGVWPSKADALWDLVEGTEATQLDERLDVQSSDVIVVKQYPSAFFGTHLASTLRAMGIDSVIVCGATTSGCVRASVVEGLEHGFRVIVAKECVGDRDPLVEMVSLFDINAKYGDVMSLSDVLDALQKLSGK